MSGADHASAERRERQPPGPHPEGHSALDARRVGWRFIALYAVSYTGRVPAVPGAAPGVLGVEGERPRRHRRRAPQPGHGHRRRVAARHRGQPPVRAAQRPHHRPGRGCDAPGWSPGVASARPGRWWSPPRRTSRSCSSAGASVRSSSTPPWPRRPPSCPTRSPPSSAGGLRHPRASASRPRRSPAPTWCRRSTTRPCSMFAVPCAVGGAAVLLFVWRLPDRRLAAAGQAAVVAARAGRHLLREPASQPGLRVGVPVTASCSSWPTRSSSPTRLLPARPGRQQRGRGAAAGVPRHRRPVRRPGRRRTRRRTAVRPSGASKGVRHGGSRHLRRRARSSSPAASTLRRVPGRHGHRRGRVRHVHGRRPRARRRRPLRPAQRRQGPGRPQHRRRPAVCSGPRRGARTAGARGRQLRASCTPLPEPAPWPAPPRWRPSGA